MIGDYSLAIYFLNKSKTELEKDNLFGNDQLNNHNITLGRYFEGLNKLDSALYYLNLVIFNKNCNDADKRSALMSKSSIYLFQENWVEFIKTSKLELELDKIQIEQTLSILSNSEREQFLDSKKLLFESYINCSLIAHYSEKNEIAYNTTLFLKNLLLESTLLTTKTINSNVILKKQYSEILNLKKLTSNKSELYVLNDYERKSKIDSLERSFMRNFPIQQLTSKNSKVESQNICDSIKNEECAIEFLSYSYNDIKYYRAMGLFPNNPLPESIHLTNQNIVDSIYQLVNEKYSTDNYSERIKELNKHFYKMFWEPIEPYLKGVKTIYYSPIEDLNNVSFSSFIINENEYLIDKYNLHSVMSTSAVVFNKKPILSEAAPSIDLYGGINYSFAKENINYEIAKNDKSTEGKIRSINSEDENLRGGISNLPFTKREIDDVADILTKGKWIVTKEYGNNATETKIKKIGAAKSPTILHFATHGFAFPFAVRSDRNQNSVNPFKTSSNPMQRSGLLFYGASDTWNGKQDSVIKYTGEDGVLTAEEVSNLDLSNTKLVVMSACQSGLGAIKGTEGVYGLKRAFRLAGVENMILSLWPVPDKETMELMNLFYSELAKTKDIANSFQTAQKTMRNKYPTNPWVWGGFVLVR